MPYIEFPHDFKMFYKIDDCTDPWTHPDTVVFVHGFTENTEAWRAWVPLLSRYYRLIRIDLRGFGKSGPVHKEFVYTTELFVDDLVRVINHLAGEPVHVVGGKSGGISSVKLAAMRPDLVKTITLASTPVTPPKAQGWIEHMEQHGMQSWARATMTARLGRKMPPRGIDWWVDMMGSTAISTAHAYLRWVGTIDIRPDLEQIKCPVLVIGTDSPRRTKSEFEDYQKCIPNSELVMIPVDGYHAAAIDPDCCASITLDFLRRQNAR